MQEIWKDICLQYQNCELNDKSSDKVYHIKPNKYEISNTGKVRNKNTKQIFAIDSQGRVTLDVMDWRYHVGLGNKSQCGRCQFRVNRLMYLTFVGQLSSKTRVTPEMLEGLGKTIPETYIQNFKNALHKGAVKFKYRKKNGEIREALGTLNIDTMGSENAPKGTGYGGPDTTIRYYDLNSKGWRSFIIDNFIDWES